MRRILLMLLMTLMSTVAFATGQASDVIYIDGQRWWLMGRLTHALDSVHYYKLLHLLPEPREESTANWDGHIGYWSLEGDLLLLDSIVVKVYEDSTYNESHEMSLPQSTMREVFGDYYRNGRIEATFVTADNIRATQGKRIFYEHAGWNRHYETELVLNVEQGRVVERTLYHNRIMVNGLYFDDWDFEEWDKFSEGFYPVIRRYHELDTVNKVYFFVNNCKADSLGHIIDIDVKVAYKDHPDVLPMLAEEFRQYLMSLHPWRVMRINGEYVAIWGSWSIPFKL